MVKALRTSEINFPSSMILYYMKRFIKWWYFCNISEWKSENRLVVFQRVVENFLGNHKSPNYKQIVSNLVKHEWFSTKIWLFTMKNSERMEQRYQEDGMKICQQITDVHWNEIYHRNLENGRKIHFANVLITKCSNK